MRRAGKTLLTAAWIAVLAFSGSAFAAETETANEPEMLQIGEAAQETDYHVELTNSTGKDITALTISVDGGDMSENLIPADTLLEDGQKAQLHHAPAPLKEGQTSAPRYDIGLVFGDGLEAVIHTFPFGDADAVTLLLDELSGDQLDEGASEETIEIAYIRFVSKSLGTEQDTQWHEWDVVAPGKAGEAAAAYAAKLAAQQAASAPAYWSDDADTAYTYDAPAGDGGNGAGNTEQCLNGGTLN